MKKTSQKSHERAEGETQITISLPKTLKDDLTELASEDDRSRSKWIVRELTAVVYAKKRASGKIVPLHAEPDLPSEEKLRAAEEPAKYKPKRKRA